MISIIVPVYNTAKYLAQCIDSILAQSFVDFELLLVNDGSTDRSGEICDEYALNDSRIFVFHKKNGGVSSARNVGLYNARGEWVCFVDSDDTFADVNALCSLMNYATDDIDLLFSRYQVFDETGVLVRKYEKSENKIFSQKEFLCEMYAELLENYQGYVWNKLFRASVVRNNSLRFDEKIRFNEDRLFVVQYACHSGKTIKFVNTLSYTHLEHSNGTIASLKDKYNREFVTDFDALILMKKEIDGLAFGEEMKELTIGGIRNSYDWNHLLMVQHGVYDKRNHWHMMWEMIKNGIFISQLRDAARPLIYLLYPRLFIRKRRG